MRKKTPYKRITYRAILLLFVLPFLSCSSISPISTDDWHDSFTRGCSKEEILNDFNLYRGKWWNYYIRGCWFADGGYYDEAAHDFNKSISLRSKDQYAARSYGLHFLDYYAHRELGIVYYHQGHYEEAKKEIENSLSTADSARARFYLNKCNEAILKTTKKELNPPGIRVVSYTDGEVINTPIAKVEGIATGDAYVSEISIQGKRLLVELAEKELRFQEDVPLRVGGNVIVLEASDLLGKSVRKDFKLTLDIRPPILYLDDIQLNKKDGREFATVTGTIEDDHGVKHLYINNTEIPITPGKEVSFKQDVPVAGLSKISLKATDIAGNETKGEQPIDRKAAVLWPINPLHNYKYAGHTNTPVRVASSKMDRAVVRKLLASNEGILPQSPSAASTPLSGREAKKEGKESSSQTTATDKISPVIHTDLKPAIVQDENLFFSIEAHDDNGVAKLFVNQSPVEIRTGKNIFFNYSLPLAEGENIVTVKAIDTLGNETQTPPVKIIRKTFALLETDARYTVACLPLRTYNGQGVSSETLYSMLLKAFDEEPKRFNFVERDRAKLEEILHEQKIGNAELASPDTAVRIGKIRAAEGIFCGAVEEDARGISVTLRLVDTETTQMLANADVYDEDKSMKNLAWLMHCLALKVKRQFPMVQGNVIHVSENGFNVDTGADIGLKLGMKLLLFREINEGGFVYKEPLDTIARVVLVQPKTSFAKISKQGAEKIKKNDIAITK